MLRGTARWRVQARQALRLVGPDQRAQPVAVVRIRQIDRIQLQPHPAGNARAPAPAAASPSRAIRSPMTSGASGSNRSRDRAVLAIAHAIAIPDQIEPGAGPDLDQMQRRCVPVRQRRETRAQHRGARHFIGVGDAAFDQTPHRRLVAAIRQNRETAAETARPPPGAAQGGIKFAQGMLRAAQQKKMHRRRAADWRRLARRGGACVSALSSSSPSIASASCA